MDHGWGLSIEPLNRGSFRSRKQHNAPIQFLTQTKSPTNPKNRPRILSRIPSTEILAMAVDSVLFPLFQVCRGWKYYPIRLLKITGLVRNLMGTFWIPIYGHRDRDEALSIQSSPDLLGTIDAASASI